MAIGHATLPRRVLRLQRLIDRSLPTAGFVAIGFFVVVTSALLLRAGGDVLKPPFAGAYTAGQNPWTAAASHPASPADALAFSSTRTTAR